MDTAVNIANQIAAKVPTYMGRRLNAGWAGLVAFF